MGVVINTCYQTSNTSKKNWSEWEERNVIKHHILLQINNGNAKKHMISKITYLYKFMMGIGRNICYQTSHTFTNWWLEWEGKDVIKHNIPLEIDDSNRNKHKFSIIYLYKLIMGMGIKDVMNHPILLQIDDGNWKKNKLSNIT